jgi:hypothetical protein
VWYSRFASSILARGSETKLGRDSMVSRKKADEKPGFLKKAKSKPEDKVEKKLAKKKTKEK